MGSALCVGLWFVIWVRTDTANRLREADTRPST